MNRQYLIFFFSACMLISSTIHPGKKDEKEENCYERALKILKSLCQSPYASMKIDDQTPQETHVVTPRAGAAQSKTSQIPQQRLSTPILSEQQNKPMPTSNSLEDWHVIDPALILEESNQ